MLTKEIVVDKIEIIGEYRHVQIRTATIIRDDDVEISRSFHRRVIKAIDNIDTEDPEITAICNVVHTQEVKDKLDDKIKEK